MRVTMCVTMSGVSGSGGAATKKKQPDCGDSFLALRPPRGRRAQPAARVKEKRSRLTVEDAAENLATRVAQPAHVARAVAAAARAPRVPLAAVVAAGADAGAAVGRVALRVGARVWARAAGLFRESTSVMAHP